MRTPHDSAHIEKGPSLAKGPAWIVGSVLAVFGLILFFKAPGTPLTTDRLPDGQVQGVSFLGFEVNAWTAWLTTTAGVLVLIGVLQHMIAKTMSLIVGLALGAAAVIALIDGSDVLGLAAANGFTALGWGVAAAILIIAALMPRRHREVADRDTTTTTTTGDAARERQAVRNQDRDGDGVRDRGQDAVRDREPAGIRDSDRDRDGDNVRGGEPARQDRVEPVHAADATAPRATQERTGRFDRSRQDENVEEPAHSGGGHRIHLPLRRKH